MEFNSRLLSQKTAFVTGSNKGIGWETIKLFAQNGANIIAHARLKNQTFEENLNELSEYYSVTITPIYFDLNSENEIKTALNGYLENMQRNITKTKDELSYNEKIDGKK